MQPISVPWPNKSSVGAKLTKGSKASIDLREEVRSSGRLHGHASNGKGIPTHPTRQIVISRPALKERADASNHNERTDEECPNGLPEGEASANLNGLAIPVKPAVSLDLQRINFVHRN